MLIFFHSYMHQLNTTQIYEEGHCERDGTQKTKKKVEHRVRRKERRESDDSDKADVGEVEEGKAITITTYSR